MCKGMEEYTQKTEIMGAIKLMRAQGANDESVVKAIVDLFNVSVEYVKSLMEAKPA